MNNFTFNDLPIVTEICKKTLSDFENLTKIHNLFFTYKELSEELRAVNQFLEINYINKKMRKIK
jgi:hypothetical protein